MQRSRCFSRRRPNPALSHTISKLSDLEAAAIVSFWIEGHLEHWTYVLDRNISPIRPRFWIIPVDGQVLSQRNSEYVWNL
jgi:hypothetical protein